MCDGNPPSTMPQPILDDLADLNPDALLADGLGLKVCCECNREKPVSKFYRHPCEPDGFMPRCKFCHNGGQDLICSRIAFSSERQLGDPSVEQIEAECRKFQAKWSAKKKASRRSGRKINFNQ